MNTIIGFFGKYIIAAALILAYIEAGPGGAKVGMAVNAVKSTALSVNWSGLVTESVVFIENATQNYEDKPIEEKSESRS